MRKDETGQPTPVDEDGKPTPGYFPDASSHSLEEPDPTRPITSSGIGMTGGVPVGSASDRKQPDTWARDRATNNNVGPGALNVASDEDEA